MRGVRGAIRPTPPLYNMGPSACKSQVQVEALRCLYFGVDTLEVSYAGGVNECDALGLDHLKTRARCTRGRSERVVLGGVPFGVNRMGLKPWAWLLTNADMHLRVGRGKPAASVRLLSAGIAASGCEHLLRRAEAALADVGGYGASRVSRVDVAYDFQGWEPTFEAMQSMVCPASFRPVYPNSDEPETFQFGRGGVVVRVYNKTAEIAAKGSHWPEYWQEIEGYDASLPVWRVEVQLRTEVLREMGLKNPGDVLGALAGLMVYGLSWASLRVPSDLDATRSRWSVHPVWRWICKKLECSEPVQRIRDDGTALSAIALVPQISGMLVSVGCHLGMREPDRVLRWVLRAMGEYHAGRATDFEQLVGQRQEERYGVSCVDGLSPLYGYLGL